MTVLVVGGAGSGKSAFAEKLTLRLSGALPRVYLATMEPFGAEAEARIAKHRRARAGKDFVTLERYTDLGSLVLPGECGVLLEDLGNLCANELYSPAGRREEAVMEGLLHVREECRHLVIVSNEVFCGGSQGDTERYLRVLARVNRRAAALAEGVCEVVCGVPAWIRRPGGWNVDF